MLGHTQNGFQSLVLRPSLFRLPSDIHIGFQCRGSNCALVAQNLVEHRHYHFKQNLHWKERFTPNTTNTPIHPGAYPSLSLPVSTQPQQQASVFFFFFFFFFRCLFKKVVAFSRLAQVGDDLLFDLLLLLQIISCRRQRQHLGLCPGGEESNK